MGLCALGQQLDIRKESSQKVRNGEDTYDVSGQRERENFSSKDFIAINKNSHQ